MSFYQVETKLQKIEVISILQKSLKREHFLLSLWSNILTKFQKNQNMGVTVIAYWFHSLKLFQSDGRSRPRVIMRLRKLRAIFELPKSIMVVYLCFFAAVVNRLHIVRKFYIDMKAAL